MNPQQKEFDTALAGLTPEQRATYMKANPTVGVGGVQQSVNNGVYQPIPKTITTGDINSSPSLTPAPPKAPIPTYNPVVTAPTGATLGTDGTATYTPPTTSQPTQASKEESLYQKTLKAIGVDISQLETKPEVTKQLQEAQQLAQKTEQATKDYNTYNLKKRELETKLREMQTAEANKVGGVGGGYSAMIQEYTRKANSELADLAIQAQASQGLLEAARQTIKDTLEAQFSPIEDRIARRTQYAQLAANDLTESEKYQLDQLNKKDEANQKEVSTYAANLANTVFENGAPVGVRTKIFNIAGDYAAGKITKEQAQVKMSEAAGNYGVKVSTAEKAPTVQKINGVDMQWNPTSGKWETINAQSATGTSASTMPLAQSKANVDQITELSGNIVSSAVGTSPFTRSQPGFWTNLGKIATIVGAPQAILGTYQRLTGEQQNFIAGVEQLRSNLNLDTLINAKARGATFGALSDQELQVLSNAATKLGSWAVKNSEGQTVGFNTTEANLKKELEKINNFARLDYIIKGGDPMDVNAQMQSDGSIWVKNSDGTLTQIK